MGKSTLATRRGFGGTLVALLGSLVCAASCRGQAAAPPPPPLAAQTVVSEVAVEAALRREIAAHPDSPEPLYRLALLLREENKPQESLQAYTKAARLRAPNAGDLRSVALDYVLLDDYADAIRWLETATASDPRNVEALYSLGRCYFTQSRFHDAEGMFLRVLEIQPQHWKALENLGLSLDAEGQPDKAEAALRKAAELAEKRAPDSPPDEWPSLDLGSFLLDHDRATEAVPFLKRAAEIAPGSAICHEKLGRALAESGRPLDGVQELETAVRLNPKNPNAHFELGHAYRRAGEMEKAKAEFSLSQELRRERDKN